MPPPRRGGGRSRSLAPPELRGALGSLLRTTLAQASAVREALERGAREGRARIDDALTDRRRTEALADLGDVVLSLIRRGRLEELADIPEIADAIAAIDDLEARGNRRERDDEEGRDWVAPESRRRFDRRRDEPSDDGTVSSRDWQPPRSARPDARVWRPRDPEPAEDTPWESVEKPPEKPAKKPARRVEPAKPRGGITFPAADDDAVGDDEDLAGYMHPDDVPPKK